MSELIVSELSKSYGAAVAVNRVSFTVGDGEFVTLLGPSGCGKSTTLAAIAGLITPEEGLIRAGTTVYFDSKVGVALPAESRDLGMVFQSYALWPHMTVRKNLEFPLSLRRIPRAERDKRIRDVLTLVEMADLIDRYPHELSGGQQQRVALARTLVYQPAILLLDEPLSNLDSKLRERARLWLADIQHRIRVTTVYVTHDHGEALSLSNRVVVMNDGRVIQIGSPREIYERPADRFVADFIGSSNFVHGRIREIVEEAATRTGVIELNSGQVLKVVLVRDLARSASVAVAIRPESIVIDAKNLARDDGTLLDARLTSRSYFGSRWHYDFDIGGEIVRAKSSREHDLGPMKIFVPLRGPQVFELTGDSQRASSLPHTCREGRP